MFGPFSLNSSSTIYARFVRCWLQKSRYIHRAVKILASLAFLHLFKLPAVYLSFELQVWLQHIFSQRLPVERVVGCGKDVPLDVLSVAAIAAGQNHRVLHQLAHDRALKLARNIVPLDLLLHSLDNQFVGSLAKSSKLSNICW